MPSTRVDYGTPCGIIREIVEMKDVCPKLSVAYVHLEHELFSAIDVQT